MQRYALLALASAALFGASTPLAKRLLEAAPPLELAGLLYLGSGVALALVWAFARRREARLAARELPWLAAATACGGIAAPWLLLVGLERMAASGASLLLNLEGVLTILVAGAAFREAVGARIWLGAALMLAGASALSWSAQGSIAFDLGPLAVFGACLFWALDNNLTRPICASDPVAIACVKGLAAGGVNLGLAALVGAAAPAAAFTAGALAVGAFGYGASLVLYVLALRHLGAARTAAHFGTAPFIGAALGVALFGEPITVQLAAGFALMAAAVWIVLRESHAHEHVHAEMEHTHRHVHDAHHQHAHRGGEGPEPHVHAHRHEAMRHSHPHFPDFHHRHRH